MASRIRWARTLIIAAGLFVLAGCSNGPTSTFAELGDKANTRGFGRRWPQDPNESTLTFGPGDKIMVTVATSEDFTGEHTIRQDGKITINVINDVDAAGLTPEQLAKKIEGMVAMYVRQPQVTVSVLEVVSKAYFVGGQEPSTGSMLFRKVPFTGDVTLFDAWVEMGSPSSPLDDEHHVKVVRGDPRNPDVATINVTEIIHGYTGANIRIRPDDIVWVPPTWLGHVARFVAGVSLPFESLLRVSRSFVGLNYTVRSLQGDTGGYRIRGLGGGGGYGY